MPSNTSTRTPRRAGLQGTSALGRYWAEHVLLHFEENYPTDERPHEAIEAGRAWMRGEIAMNAARTAARAAGHVALLPRAIATMERAW